MTSFAQIFGTLDEEIISTLDTSEIDRVRCMLDRESSRRRAKDAVTCLKEWVDKQRTYSVYYHSAKSGICEICLIDLKTKYKQVFSCDLDLGYLPQDPKEQEKMIKTLKKQQKQTLAAKMLFYIKTLKE